MTQHAVVFYQDSGGQWIKALVESPELLYSVWMWRIVLCGMPWLFRPADYSDITWATSTRLGSIEYYNGLAGDSFENSAQVNIGLCLVTFSYIDARRSVPEHCAE